MCFTPIILFQDSPAQVTHSSLGLPDSWSLHSAVNPHNLTNASIWEDMHDQAASRISIGSFMAARTEALGSLDVSDRDRVSNV